MGHESQRWGQVQSQSRSRVKVRVRVGVRVRVKVMVRVRVSVRVRVGLGPAARVRSGNVSEYHAAPRRLLRGYRLRVRGWG